MYTNDIVSDFATKYVEELNSASDYNDWEMAAMVRRDARNVAADINRVVKAIDFLTNLGLRVK